MCVCESLSKRERYVLKIGFKDKISFVHLFILSSRQSRITTEYN